MAVVTRVLRVGLGAVLLLVAVPLMLAGGGLWLMSQHRHDGAFTAALERTRTDGRAIVVTDVDAVLRRDVPFARGGQTTLTVQGRQVFLGLARESDVRRYLDGASYATVTRVRLARGPLPVDLTPAAGDALEPAHLPKPADQSFWIRTDVDGKLAWSPSSVRGQHLAVVVMNADGRAGVDVALSAGLAPAWVPATAGGLVIGGTALFLLGLLAAAWPTARTRRRRFSGVPTPAADSDVEPTPAEDVALAPIPGIERDPVLEGVIEAHPEVTKVLQDEPAEPAGPPSVLPPVNLRLTWPALPGSRQKEDLKG